MLAQFSLFNLLILIGVTQGLVTAVLLFRTTNNKLSNHLLAYVLMSFCFLSTKILISSLNWWEINWIRYFPNGIELALAPLVYLYTKSLTEPHFSILRKRWLHFVPFGISQLYAFVVYFKVVGISNNEEKDVIASTLFFNEVKNTEDYLALISLFVYLSMGYIELRKYRNWIKINLSDNTIPEYTWLRNIFLLFSFLGLLLFLNLGINTMYPDDPSHDFRWQSYFTFISFLIYYLGFMGYQQRNADYSLILKTNTIHDITTETYDEEVIRLITDSLEQKKVFLNPKLSIQELAESLQMNQRSLSNAINGHFKQPFRDLINGYRVEEAKKNLLDPKYSHLSVLGIALEAGFNSEASFYRIFKKNTGISPKEYIEQNS